MQRTCSRRAGAAAARAAGAAQVDFPPRAKRVIYLFMAGAPSQLDLFDPKPALTKHDGQDIPDELIKGERFAFIKGTPKLLASPFKFTRTASRAREISELLPHLAKVADDIAIVRSMHTTQFNHAPAQIFMNTGHQVSAGRAWARGSATAWAARTATCPASSCCSPARTSPTAASRAGAAASCRPCTRASSSARAATRCCSSRTPRASTRGAPASLDRRAQRPQPAAAPRRRRSRRSRPASPPTSWPTACRRACPS